MDRARTYRGPGVASPAPGARRRATALVVGALAVSVSTALAACASGSPVPSDPKLATGQEVYNARCVTCHGATGGGGAGPRLIGIADRMTVEQEIATITDGVDGTAMPAWGGQLSAEEIDAVAAYTRSLPPS